MSPTWLRKIAVGSWGEIADTSPADPATGRWRPDIERAYIAAGLLTKQSPKDTAYGRIGGITEYSGAGFRRASSTVLLFGGGGAGAGASNGVCGCSLNADIPVWEQIVNPTSAAQLWPRGTGPTSEYLKNGDPNSQHSGGRPQFCDLDDMMIVGGASQTWELDAGNFANVNAWTWAERKWHSKVTPPFTTGSAQVNAIRAMHQGTGDWWAIGDGSARIGKWTRSGPPAEGTPWIPNGAWNYQWKTFRTQSAMSDGGAMAVDTDRDVFMLMMGFNWAISTSDPAIASAEGFAFGGPSGAYFRTLRLISLCYIPIAVGGAWGGRFAIYEWSTGKLYTLAHGRKIDAWNASEVQAQGQAPPVAAGGYTRFICDPALKCLYVLPGKPPNNDAWANIWAFRLA